MKPGHTSFYNIINIKVYYSASSIHELVAYIFESVILFIPIMYVNCMYR